MDREMNMSFILSVVFDVRDYKLFLVVVRVLRT